ncbi:MAG: epoxide hydrolase family protein [Phycicoccus sp.]
MEAFRSNIPQEEIEDLHARLRDTRWPAPTPVHGWERGIPVAEVRELADTWLENFDWRVVEARLNRHPQFVTEIDGARIHLVHVRSPEPDAVPLILTHGWPGSVLEFLDVIGPLTDPRAHSREGAQAFHVVIPSLPGFGFSGPVDEAGWGVPRIAAAWSTLMEQLGYDTFFAHGGDLGTWISLTLAATVPERVLGVSVNFLLTPPTDPSDLAGLAPEDLERLQTMGDWIARRSGYMWIQGTAPQTLSYGLTDSPVGQLAWLAEKYSEWSDSTVADSVTREQLLGIVSLYWFTRTAGSAAQIYFEMRDELPIATTPAAPRPPLSVPLGVSVFRQDASLPVRSLADRAFPGIRQWREHEHGGHFSSLERPEEFVDDLSDFVAGVLGEQAAA